MGRLAYMVVLGTINSVFGVVESLVNGPKIRKQPIEHAPLFVIGHWRSGTTHLQNLMSLDENFTYPTAYQASFPHHFVFSLKGTRIFDLVAPKKRPMDNMAFSANVPHEDEFALAADATVSPYMRMLFPVTGDNGYSELDPRRLSKEALELWKKSLVRFLKKVALADDGRLVLKSPPHLGRVGTLLELFPEAQFIHIVRDPYTVYMSTHKLWRNTFSYGHLQIPPPELLDEIILSWYTELFDLFERDRHLIPEGSLHQMKFEDLEQNPLESLEKVYGDLRLPGFDRFRKTADEYLSSIRDYKKNEYEIADATREKVSRRWRRSFERYGYPM